MAPLAGSVLACATTTFGGGGAYAVGPWIRDDGTFDLTAKVLVGGTVVWPQEIEILDQNDARVIRGNGLPDHPTGRFPIAPGDDAYRYDTNPNTIRAQQLEIALPLHPQLAREPVCVPQGPIGVLLTGSMFFNALDARGEDAVAHEIQDGCQGHPERTGTYHYHSLTTCLDDGGSGHSPLVGYAFDGFAIYGHRGDHGQILTNDDLDACHGHNHVILWDEEMDEMYHYHATWEYPYTVGCYRSTPARGRALPAGPGGPPPV